MEPIQLIKNIIRNGVTNGDERTLLADSLFYYCSGKDPSPIIAFGAEYPLYIYSDNDYYSADVSYSEVMTAALQQRLQTHGFAVLETKILQTKCGREQINNIIVTQWSASDNRTFCVAFFPYDSYKVFKTIYSDTGTFSNLIQPKCICNYRYEFMGETARIAEDFFSQIETRTEFVLGYCFDDRYKVIAEYDYYGDYDEPGTRMSLFHREK